MSEDSSLLSTTLLNALYGPQPSQTMSARLIKIAEYILYHYGKNTENNVFSKNTEPRVFIPAHSWFILFENGYIQKNRDREITISSYNVHEYYMKTVNHHSFICTNGTKFLDSLGKVIWGKYQKKKSFDQLYIEAYDELFNTNTGRIINQLR